MSRELRICNHVHKCNYGKDNVGGSCMYAKPANEKKSNEPLSGHCITVSKVITVVPLNADHKSKDPNISFKMHKAEKTLE